MAKDRDTDVSAEALREEFHKLPDLTRLMRSRSWIPDGTDPLTCVFAASGELSGALNPRLRMTWCLVSADGEEEEDEPRWLTRCSSQLTYTGEQQQLTNGTDCHIQQR